MSFLLLKTDDIYGKKDKNFDDDKGSIRHLDIFAACLSKLEIGLCFDDAMDYVYALASDERNIVSLQIITVDSIEQVVIGMNLNSTSPQLDVLYNILRYFADYNFGFTGDICYGNDKETIYNENSDDIRNVSMGLEEYWQRLTTALADLKGKKRSGK